MKAEYTMTGKGYGDNLSQVTLTGFVHSGEDSPPARKHLQQETGGNVNPSFEMPADDFPNNGLSGEFDISTFLVSYT